MDTAEIKALKDIVAELRKLNHKLEKMTKIMDPPVVERVSKRLDYQEAMEDDKK